MIAFGLALPGDVRLLAGIYAFGATLAIAIAHVSIVRLRWTEPDRERPYPDPVRRRRSAGGDPDSGGVGAVLMVLLWLAVIAFHARARWVGGGWMVFGLIAYFVYRRYVGGDVR